MNPFAQALDREFQRVAREEEIAMEDLVYEVSQETNYSTRMIYNFRSGKTALTAELIPYFCARFKSRALLNCLTAICDRAIPVTVPEDLDLPRITTAALRDTLRHHDAFLGAFSDDAITKQELDHIKESGARLRSMTVMFEEIAERAYEITRA